jgi:orotate phosphoribosyltransferase
MNVEQLFLENGALLKGHFLLSSGLHSDRYLQCALVLAQPGAAEKLGYELATKSRLKPDLVLSPAMGGLMIGHEVARAYGVRHFFTERVDGTMVLRRADVIGAVSVVDRSEGKSNLGVPYTALWAVSVPAWKPEECPLCKTGIPAVKPGSRTEKK